MIDQETGLEVMEPEVSLDGSPEQEAQRIESERVSRDRAQSDSLHAENRRLRKTLAEKAEGGATRKPGDIQKQIESSVNTILAERDRESEARSVDRKIITKDSEAFGVKKEEYGEAIKKIVHELAAEGSGIFSASPLEIYAIARNRYFKDNPEKAIRFYQGSEEPSEQTKRAAGTGGGGSPKDLDSGKSMKDLSDAEKDALYAQLGNNW